MKWGSIIDGKNLYYIPSDEVEITLPDGTVTTTHPRLIYNLDTETGEETVAFNFDGDYVALSVGFMSNDLIVYDNKIFTAELTGTVFSKAEDGTVTSKKLSLKDGIVIIDMVTNDITYVTANYIQTETGDIELSWNSDIIHMNKG